MAYVERPRFVELREGTFEIAELSEALREPETRARVPGLDGDGALEDRPRFRGPSLG